MESHTKNLTAMSYFTVCLTYVAGTNLIFFTIKEVVHICIRLHRAHDMFSLHKHSIIGSFQRYLTIYLKLQRDCTALKMHVCQRIASLELAVNKEENEPERQKDRENISPVHLPSCCRF